MLWALSVLAACVLSSGFGYFVGSEVKGLRDEAIFAAFLKEVSDESEQMKLLLDLDD
jgi:hypothetical protein